MILNHPMTAQMALREYEGQLGYSDLAGPGRVLYYIVGHAVGHLRSEVCVKQFSTKY